MTKYIDVDELREYWLENGENEHIYDTNDFLESIDNAPAADVVEVRHGQWEWKKRRKGGFRKYTGIDSMGETHTVTVDERHEINDPFCPYCGKINDSIWLNFCPNCGEKMDGEES